MKTVIFIFLFRLLWTTGAVELEICTCPEFDGQIRCSIESGVSLNREGSCGGDSLRVSGDGFVIEAETIKRLKEVVLEKTTMSCEDGFRLFLDARELVLNGVTCTMSTTSTKEPRRRHSARPEGPRRRPPVYPDDNDDDNDGDNDNDDDDGNDEHGDTTSTITTTTIMSTTTTTITTTFRAIIVTSATLGHWWIVVAFGVVVSSACVIVVIRVRYCKRQRNRRVQDPTVSSSTTHDDDNMAAQSFVLREVPRSPRRRGSSMVESVVLYAVDKEL